MSGSYSHRDSMAGCVTGKPLTVSSGKQRARGPWSAYPLGTVAYSSIGGWWTRVADGWKANGGDTFPRPAADAFWVKLPGTTPP